MKFINLTRRTEIGANSYYLEMGGYRLVLDCGMHPKDTGEDALPNFKAIAGQEIEAILISHAHQDHIGTLPVLMRRFPTARIFMTRSLINRPTTFERCSIAIVLQLLKNAGKLAPGGNARNFGNICRQSPGISCVRSARSLRVTSGQHVPVVCWTS